MVKKALIILLLICYSQLCVLAQDRFDQLQKDLEKTAQLTPGLNETVDFSVSGVSIQEFLRGIAESNQLNISIDPKLDIKIFNNFTNEKVSNILLYLCKEYDLEVKFVGSIMRITQFEHPVLPPPPMKEYQIDISYEGAGNLISMNLRRDTLEDILTEIARLTKKNVLPDPSINKQQQITASIVNSPFDKALELLAYSNGMKVEKWGNDYKLIPADKEEEEEDTGRRSTRSGRPAASRDRNRKAKSNKSKSDYFIEINDSLGEKYVSFAAEGMPIADAIKEVALEMGENYFLFSEPKGETSTSFDKVTFDQFLSYILQGSQHTFKLDQDIYLIGERKLEGLRTTSVVKLQFRSYEEVMNAIPGELKEGVEISEFQDLNALILSGSGLQINEIKHFIHEIDISVPMVMIEVIMVEISKGRTTSVGLKAGKSDTVTTGGSLLPTLDLILGGGTINNTIDGIRNRVGPLNLGRVSPNFYIQLNALEDLDNVHIRSMPKLSTLNGHEATMRVGETRYYSVQTQNVVGSVTTNTVVTQQYNSVQADLSISIKPIVSGDGEVTLDIDVEISDFIGTPAGNEPPPSRTSQFTSLIRVGDEEMVLLGGIERQERSDNSHGVPLLSRIPVIKWFFGQRTKSKSKSISVVFIKPTIID